MDSRVRIRQILEYMLLYFGRQIVTTPRPCIGRLLEQDRKNSVSSFHSKDLEPSALKQLMKSHIIPLNSGVGGHISVCNYLLSLCTEHTMLPERMLVNSQTKDGNTVLMWAAWSRSLDIVKFLVRNRTDATTTNRNGCSVAHWASSGGGKC